MWLLSLLVGCSLLLFYEEGARGILPLPYLIGFLICFAVIIDLMVIYLYYNVYRSINQQKVRLQVKQATLNEISMHRKNRRMAKLIGVTIAVFEICWLPYSILYSYIRITEKYGIENSKIIRNMMAVAQLLAYCNSGVNGFIYAGISPVFRESIRKILCCGRQQKIHQIASSLEVATDQPSQPI